MVKPGGAQGGQPGIRQTDAGGDEVGVEAEPVGMLDQFFQVFAQQGFAARQAQLHGAQRARLGEDVAPLRSVELGVVPGIVHRIGAEGAMERAAVGQFRQQP